MTTMYRVTQINSSAGVGGGERHLMLLARYLHGTEFQFDFILPEEDSFCDELARAKLPYQIVPMQTKFRIGARRDITNILRANGTDLAHCHGARANSYGRVAARRSGAGALFCTVHNSLKDYPYPAWRRRLYLELEKRTAHLVDQWIAVSRAIGDDLVNYYGLPAGKIEVIPNGIEVDELRVNRAKEKVRQDLGVERDAFVVLEIARMTEQKGHRFLLEAISSLRTRIPKLRCLLVGDGPARRTLERQAERLQIADRVLFLGFRSDVADLINAADVYVLPSLSEGMPFGILEAMAMGCAVVASAVDGVPEVVSDRVDGLLAPPADAAALTSLLKELAMDPSLRHRLGPAARQKVRERFAAGQMAQRVGDLYRFHLQGGNSPS